MEKRINFSKIIGTIIVVVLVLSAGYFLYDRLNKSTGGDTKTNWIFVVVMIVAFFFFDTLMIVIHELGHLIMGLLTGYRFVSFRVGSRVLVKQNGKLVLRRNELDSGGGQCLMIHDIVEKDEDIHFFWYHFGGGFFNFISAGIYCLVFMNASSRYVTGPFKLAALMSLYYGLVNILPLGILGISNDGNNILAQLIFPKMRRLLLNRLIIDGRKCQGETIDEMPDSLFVGGDPMGVPTEVIVINDCANRDYARRDFESAKAKYNAILLNETLIKSLRYEASCEALFCNIITNESAEIIDNQYEELKGYIQSTEKALIDRHRLMFAYYYIYKQDKESADKEYDLALKMSEKYFCLGDAKAEMALIEYIKENY